MARKGKLISRSRTPKPKAAVKSKTKNQGNQVQKRKRSTVSEPNQPRQRSKRLRRSKSSSSVELVRVEPCCRTAEERKKYAKLGLNSALFFARSRPARRRQSHISVVTILSSDDEEDSNNDNTADWVSNIDMDTINISSNEEPFPSGDAGLREDESMNTEIQEAEMIRSQRSLLGFPLFTEAIFRPLCASTPQHNLSTNQPSLDEPEENLAVPLATNSLAGERNCSSVSYKHTSFLENPMRKLSLSSTGFVQTAPPHTTPIDPNQKIDDWRFRSNSVFSSGTPKFYFGPSQSAQQLREVSDSIPPLWSDMSYFNSTQTSSEASPLSLSMESGRVELEERRYSLEQIPSTSHAPISHPVLEVTPVNKFESRSNSPSK